MLFGGRNVCLLGYKPNLMKIMNVLRTYALSSRLVPRSPRRGGVLNTIIHDRSVRFETTFVTITEIRCQ